MVSATCVIAKGDTLPHYFAQGGCFIGAAGAGWYVYDHYSPVLFLDSLCARANDKWGRKRTIQVTFFLLLSTSQDSLPLKIGCLFALWGSAMQCGASNVATLLVGRIIGGLSIGYVPLDHLLFAAE